MRRWLMPGLLPELDALPLGWCATLTGLAASTTKEKPFRACLQPGAIHFADSLSTSTRKPAVHLDP